MNGLVEVLFEWVRSRVLSCSVYRQLTVQCSGSNTSHIQWEVTEYSALDTKINYSFKATAELNTEKVNTE